MSMHFRADHLLLLRFCGSGIKECVKKATLTG